MRLVRQHTGYRVQGFCSCGCQSYVVTNPVWIGDALLFAQDVERKRAQLVTIVPQLLHTPGDCHAAATCTVTPIADKVTSTEQLAAALHLPPAAVFEMPTPQAPQTPRTLLSKLIDAAAALALALIGVRQPRKDSR